MRTSTSTRRSCARSSPSSFPSSTPRSARLARRGVGQLRVGRRGAVGVSLPAPRDRDAGRRARARGAAARRSAAPGSDSGADASSERRASASRWPFFGAPLLRGVEPADAGLTDDERVAARSGARPLPPRRCMRRRRSKRSTPSALLPVDSEPSCGHAVSACRCRASVSRSLRGSRAPRRGAASSGSSPSAEALPPSDDASVLVHGDLHLRHVLVEQRIDRRRHRLGRRLRRQIRRSTSCSSGCSPLAAGRARFFEAYGPIDDERVAAGSRARALFSARCSPSTHATVGIASLERECVAGLERTLID